MDFRVHDKEDFDKTIAFLEMEKKMDAENFKEMLLIEPSHLTKAKITALGKLGGQWKKQSDSLIKNYKEQNKVKTSYHKIDDWHGEFTQFSNEERKRTWFMN